MKATIIISNYNYARFLRSSIESCLAQTYPCDIIEVDDASTDNSWETALEYVKDGVQVVRLKDNSRGNARGKNVGICLSKNPYITCLDSDDMILPDSIERRMEFISDSDFVHGWSHRVGSNEEYSSIMRTPGLLTKRFKFNARAKKLLKEVDRKAKNSVPRWSFAIEASTVLANKCLYEKFGLYDEDMRWSIDREMWWRWLSHGVTKHILKEYVSIYRKHAGQVTRDRHLKNHKECTR